MEEIALRHYLRPRELIRVAGAHQANPHEVGDVELLEKESRCIKLLDVFD
jgi:hypothetical protein